MSEPTDKSENTDERKYATADAAGRNEGHDGKDPAVSRGHRKQPGGAGMTASVNAGPSPAPGKSSRLADTYATVQRKETGAPIAAQTEAPLARAREGSGTPLQAQDQADLGNALGTDLSGVRVHDGGPSNVAAKSIGAKAYTEGQDIHFASGQYAPASSAGQHLLAHEVAHTVQQKGSSPSVQNKPEISAPGDSHEREADGFADSYVAGRATGDGYSFVSMSHAPVSPGSVSGGIHRAKDPEADFDNLSYGEQESLFRAAALEQQLTYFFSVSRFNRRYTLFTSLETVQRARLIPRISADDRGAFLEQLPVGDIADWYRDQLLNPYHQQLVYVSMSSSINAAFVAKMAGRVAGLMGLLTMPQRSALIAMIPANSFENFFESFSGSISKLYESVPSDMKPYVFAMMPRDMQNEVAVDSTTDDSESTNAQDAPARESSDADALAKIERTLDEVLRSTDAYTSAVNRLNVEPLSELGQSIAGDVKGARAGVSQATGGKGSLGQQLSATERTVANSIGPNRFRGRSTLGRSQDLLPKNDVAGYVAEKTTAVGELISTVVEVKELLGDDPSAASDSAREKAVSKVELWRSNFLHFQFVRRVLTDEGLYAGLRNVKGSSGAKLKDTADEVVEEWRRLGESKNNDPWYVLVGRAVEAGVELLLPDFEDLPEIVLRINPILLAYDAGGYAAEAAGNATGIYDYEHQPESLIGQTVDPIARDPEGAYNAAVEALAEHFLRVESGDPEAIGQSVALVVSLLVPGAEEAIIAGAAKLADDLARAAKQLRKLGLDKAAEKFIRHEDELRNAAGKVHGSGDGGDASAAGAGNKKPDPNRPGVGPQREPSPDTKGKPKGRGWQFGDTGQSAFGKVEFGGLVQNRPMRDLSDSEIRAAFQSTPYKPSNHAISRLLHKRTADVGIRTLNDVARVLNKGAVEEAGRGLISIQRAGFEAIVNPETKVLVTFSPQ